MTEPFLICSLPGERAFRRYTFTGTDEATLQFAQAKVQPWPGISFSAEQPMSVPLKSGSQEKYVAALDELIPKLKTDGRKTVICRNICGNFRSFTRESLDALVNAYFAKFPDMMCFLFYHPSCGYWMGASPELLLDVEDSTHARTRALAGTRCRGSAEAWSEKNVAEHRVVVDDICKRVGALEGLSALAVECTDFHYGTIEHLCTPISICVNGRCVDSFPADEVIEAIHPTAAVCGYPREDAIKDIERYEESPRNCYGGVLTLDLGGRSLSYVILRCVHFDEKRWAVYTGSGITGESIALDEWNETETKASPLVDLLSKY